MTEPVATQHITEVKLEVASLRAELQTGMARIEGHLSNVATSMDATRRELDQAVRFQGDLLKALAGRVSVLEQWRMEDRDRAAMETSSVRVALETADDALEGKVDAMEARMDRLDGWIKALAALGAVVGPAVTALLVKAFGS